MNQDFKLIKLKIFQPKACYTTPLSFKGIETFPLPTFSNIRGMLYTALGRKYQEGDDFRFSIQGNYESIYRDYWNAVKYGDKGRGKKPIEVPTLHNVNLIIHIYTNKYEEVKAALANPKEFLSLGRKEDLIRIDEIKEINYHLKDLDKETKSFILKNNSYIAMELGLDITGIPYRLPSFWEIKSGFRVFTPMVNVYYLEAPIILESGKIYIDEEGDPVWLKIK